MSGPNPPAQLSNAFANGSPQLMTITAGANDAHWASFLRTCYVSDCATNATTLTANTYLTLLKGKLALAMQDIQARSGNNRPEVVITGYYNPISANCVSSQITPSEITWLTNETTALNQVIQAAASHYSFATFVPINFTGHDLCSNNPWTQGLNDPAPFHPTTEGQQAVADAILESPTVQTFNR
jgi:lysophospholipase L1-like esterase